MTRVPSLGPRGEGWVVLQLVAIALIGLAGSMGPGLNGDPGPAEAIAVVLAAALFVGGGLLAISGVVTLRRARSLTAVPHPLPDAGLAHDGPYRLVRHPIYLALILIALGWSMARASVPALAATLALVAILDLKRRREEAWLGARFPAYAAYRRRTRALIPFLY